MAFAGISEGNCSQLPYNYAILPAMTLEEEVVLLRAENAELRRQLTVLVARIGELEQQGEPPSAKPPPSFVKPNRPKRETPDGKRQKRDKKHNTSRRRETPTRFEPHALEQCPVCAYHLTGESLDYSRQVIELPPPSPVEVTEHRVVKRWCPHCDAWRSPTLDLSQQVFGQGRIGVGIASLVSCLRTVFRMTIRHIQTYLHIMHGLWLSIGEITELTHHVRIATEKTVEDLKKQIKQSPVIHGDETGWRENGQNGYVWVLTTPGADGIRYYEYDHSRGQSVVDRLLKNVRDACLVTDFYCGYNNYAGPQQRCWVHLLRDLHELKEEQAQDTSVLTWAGHVRRMYDNAQTWCMAHPAASPAERAGIYQELVNRAVALGTQYAQVRDHPCNALAKRLMRHQDELFQFVLRDGVSADNNLAERTIRPLVVIRKISGGTRSDKGTKTRLGLATLFGTWHVRGLNPFVECLRLLSHPPPQTSLP
jgi:transposase